MELPEKHYMAETESFYYASLFAKCDPLQVGLVKVSALLSTLHKLQALAMESCEDEDNKSCGNELLELKRELDPKNEDPKINLGQFTDGITAYLEKSKWTGSSDQFDDKPVEFDITRGENEEEFIGKKETDLLHAELADLKLQFQKVSEDNVLLRNHVRATQDENYNVLQALDKKELELKLQAERIKRLELEVDDKTEIICGLEGRNAILCKKFTQLGNELSTFQKERKRLASENAHLKEQMKKSLQLLNLKQDQMQTEATVAEGQWQEREKSLKDRINSLNTSIEEMSKRFEELEYEYSKLRLKQSKKTKIELSKVVTCADEFESVDDMTTSVPDPSSLALSFAEEHCDNFFFSIVSNDIETEMFEAGVIHQLPVIPSSVERFDVAIQCEKEGTPVLENLPVCCQCLGNIQTVNCVHQSHNEIETAATGFTDQYLIAEYIPMENRFEEGINLNLLWNWMSEILRKGLKNLVWILLILCILGLISFCPIDDGCITNPSLFGGIEDYFKYCGQLSHDKVPII